MISETFAAMGTTFVVHADRPRDITTTRKQVDAYEHRFSRFIADSELSQLNRHPGKWQWVSADMGSVLAQASEGRRASDGLFDIGVGGAVNAWGYDRTFRLIPDRVTVAAAAMQRVTWDYFDGQLRIGQGTTLDLGGIVKGWACDQVVGDGLATMLSAGGDIRSAVATTRVELLDDKGEAYADVALGVGALATSSIAKRTWKTTRGKAHHLIDPHEGRPAVSPVVQSTVVADDTVVAEVAAKTVIIKGVNGLAWADGQPSIRQAVVLWHDGSVYATREKVPS
jgi:thiamine biosynthesis lipoprotein